MKILEMTAYLKSLSARAIKEETTCDRIKAGDENEEIRKIGVTMFATPEVIREAHRQGINFLIVHEPVFYNHMDSGISYPIGEEKKRLIEECGITIFRFHDYAHGMDPDLIYDGQIEGMGLAGECEKGKYFAVNRYRLQQEMTAAELAAHLEKQYDIRHIRIAGCTDKKGSYLSCCFGTPGHVVEELYETDFVLTGEICEWEVGEAARDLAQFGYNKAILVLGHIGSEREGMKLLARRLQQKFPQIPTTYIEGGEVYAYAD